jgi:predicted ATPase/DNA-binding SARP family transcriptional activator
MARLTLGLLGSLQVMEANAPVTTFESDKARALLAYLAVEANQPHRREALLGLLWPDCPEEIARRNLRQSLYNLRQAIGDHTADPPYLFISRDELQFNTASDHALDVATFRALLAASEAHQHSQLERCAACAARLQRAVGLYRGKFLQEFFLEDSAEFEEWAVQQRESLHRRALEALAHLANYYEQRAGYEEACGYVLRQLELDPWREEAHRQLMRVLAASGRRSEALAQYETCRRVLAKELGAEPSAETRALYEQIKNEGGRAKDETMRPLSVISHPSALPVPRTPFIGRERELEQVAQLLAAPQCRLLTLVGPGGIGKTRLALQAAASLCESFAHGAAFAPLASVDSTNFLASAIGETIGLKSHGPGDPKAQLLNHLRDRQMLLILDNVEHLLTEGAPEGNATGLFLEILDQAPKVKLLITSREQLNLQQEWVFEVGGLEVPANDQAEAFEKSSAVALFLQRAQRARVGFWVQDRERQAIVRICRLVDGTPLGIELAAVWVRTLSPDEIAREIERGLDFLATSTRDLTERHRSMRAVFDHSWRLLSEEERCVLRGLSIFCGGFTREAAQAVVGARLPLLSALIGKSLLRRTEDNRYSLHELVRQYAEERQRECDEFEEMCRKHSRFFLGLAEEAEPQLIGTEQVSWLDRLEKDHDNLRAALEWSLQRAEKMDGLSTEERDRAVQECLRFVGALYLFWKRRDHWSEGRDWIGRALSHTAKLPGSSARAKALNGAVLLAVEQADVETAKRLSEENLALSTALHDPYSLAAALNSEGYLLWKQKNFGAARARCEEALALFRALGNKFSCAEALHYLGHIATNQGEYPDARRYLDESVSTYDEIGDKFGLNFSIGDLGLVAYLQDDCATAHAYFERSLRGFQQMRSIPGIVSQLNGLGDLARYRGDFEEAGRLYTESLELYRAMGDRDEIPSMLHNLGYVEHHRGDGARALALFQEALAMQCEMGNQPGIAECLAGIAGVLGVQGQARQGARLLGAAEALRESADAVQWLANRIEYSSTLELFRQSLEPSALAAAWEEGRRMTLEGAVSWGRNAKI